MAITQNTYTGNGSTTNYSFTFPYLETTDIKVSLNGVDTTAYTLANATTISFNTAPANGAAIRIYRDTDDSALAATFYPGSAIRSQDLNDNFTQNLYVVQEVNNNAVQIDGGQTMVGNLNMGGYDVINLATQTALGYSRWRKVATAGQTTFSGTGDSGGVLAYLPIREQVFINGVLQQRDADYSASNGTSITFSVGLVVGDIVEVVCINSIKEGSLDNASEITYDGQFTGQSPRTVAAKLADVVSVKDFGAVGDGVADDASAFQLAATAAGSNGTVYVPKGTYIINSNVTATNTRFVIEGFLGGSGSIIGNGNSIEILFPSQYPINSVFGAFKAAQQIRCSEAATHIGDARSNFAVKRQVLGSGVNGPASADYGLFSEVEKTNWLTSTADGEIDGGYFVVRQGSKSDAGGILIDAKKVAGGDGGSVAIESASEWVNSAGVRQIGIQAILGFLEGAGGWSANTGYGLYLEAKAGTTFSAITALGHNDGGPNSPGAFQNLITFYSDRLANSGELVYKVDGAGRTYAPSGTVSQPSYSFHEDVDTGLYRLGANAFGITTGGVVKWYWDNSGSYIPAANSSFNIGAATNRVLVVYADNYAIGGSGASLRSGTNSPEGAVASPPGSLYVNTNGGSGTTLYVKESGTGNTGWVAK